MTSNPHALAPAPDHCSGPGEEQQQQQHYRNQSMRRESAPPSLFLGGNNFNGGGSFLGRVPNFSSQYLSSLNNASSISFEQQAPQHPSPLTLSPPQQQATTMNHEGNTSPTSADGLALSGGGGVDAILSGATIVSNAVSLPAMMSAAPSSAAATTTTPASLYMTPPEVVITTAKKHSRGGNGGGEDPRAYPHSPNKRDRRHTIPPSILLSPSQQAQRHQAGVGLGLGVAGVGVGGVLGTAACPLPPTHPVPEFLCHLYSMLNDPALSGLISWVVPPRDETTDLGGGRAGMGKIVVHNPTRLQDEVLGKYYRHSKYSSFQRQLNYFGFKKRLHGSKKGKMCPCSFVHDTLGPSPRSLLNLKRRPPSGRRMGGSGSEPNLLTAPGATGGGAPKVAVGLKPKRIKRASLPTNVSLGSSVGNPVVASAKGNDSKKNNATWVTNGVGAPGTAPPVLMMPTLAQVTAASFPGNSWLMPTTIAGNNNPINVAPSSASFPAADMINSSGAGGPDKNEEIERANNAVLEAKKSLARNFLKSQREAQRAGDVQTEGISAQKQQPPAVQSRNVEVQQQQQLQQPLLRQPQLQQPQLRMSMPAPNRFPNPFFTLAMSDFGRVQPAQPPSRASNENDWMGHHQQQQEPLVKPSLLPAKTIAFPANFNATNTPQANNNLIGYFPNKTPIIVGNNHIGSLSSSTDTLLTSAATAASTNYLMAPKPADGIQDSHPLGAVGTPEIQFNELLSNLLSTSLPPSEELFDDDMSAGNISADFGLGTALQVADDGMLLPE